MKNEDLGIEVEGMGEVERKKKELKEMEDVGMEKYEKRMKEKI